MKIRVWRYLFAGVLLVGFATAGWTQSLCSVSMPEACCCAPVVPADNCCTPEPSDCPMLDDAASAPEALLPAKISPRFEIIQLGLLDLAPSENVAVLPAWPLAHPTLHTGPPVNSPPSLRGPPSHLA